MSEVVVIGGGIAGITAALDLANHHIHVHLIEREPTIGGHMAMLDKTFPTNDCSMCILSPKMVDAYRHPKITLHTCTEVTGIKGELGNFQVQVIVHPRYIKEEDCTGCDDCVTVCPVEVYNRFDAGIGVRKAIYKAHPQVVPNIVIRDVEHCINCGLCYDVCGKNAILRDNEDGEEEAVIHAAAVIIATGYEVFDATLKSSYHYRQIPDVITSIEFERMINASGPTSGALKRLSTGDKPKNIVFIQCVGSRDCTAGSSSCSAVCCMYAIKNALLIKEKSPDTEVSVLYMDIRSYGKGYEEFYNRAIQTGVRFIRGRPGELYQNGSQVRVQVENTESQEIVKIDADLVVLSVGLRPSADTATIAERYGIPCDETGFFDSVDQKVNHLSTIRPGIFIAGTCREPMDIPDTVAEGGAAAMRAVITCLKGEHAAI
ncbi:MAG: CoB--CoM heterodisulfide reductase iron-sulfur subunit A family protein [Methanospirillum sp.]|uniref:CoB--CoM heterodisulfide reductase iron-sulfur subunit A family protein n=1 Tax=Methanospirillum sp. TaxID=45200 RepID=UPI00236C8160|nr:CoB--CoM heterodisulfide reductase iron-sulfur subunit A family protein [Methanospirillum sp.]MDD1730276.1 CoB--CoM heterodisulfide reductase iron-sulfur subunit A family protein [Methanospirillum sp.]